MISPQKLVENSKIAIISPAGYVDEKFVYAAKKILETSGFRPIIYPNCLNRHNRYSGTDEQRLSDIQNAINNKDIKAILCSRGGYGSLRIAEKIDFTEFKKNPKWIIGFSDITTLHSIINNKCGVKSIHGPMAKAFYQEPDSASVSALINILKEKMPEYKFPKSDYNKNGSAEGTLTGGNLSTIFSLQATDYSLNTDNKILFIEDLNEYFYHIDRIMLNLKLSGKLKNLKALVVGAFTDLIDSEISFGKKYQEIILDHVSDYDYPVIFDFPAGHINNNMPIVLGAKIKISTLNNTVNITYA